MNASITSEPQDRGEDIQPTSRPSRPGNGSVLDRKFLEEVLDRALVAPDPSRALAGEDWEALLEIGRARGEEPFTLDPIAIELVQAVLRPYLGKWKSAPDFLRKISREIAGTLFEDPVFHHRLRTFWLRLIEASL